MCGKPTGQGEQSDLRKDWTPSWRALGDGSSCPLCSSGFMVACLGFFPHATCTLYLSGKGGFLSQQLPSSLGQWTNGMFAFLFQIYGRDRLMVQLIPVSISCPINSALGLEQIPVKRAWMRLANTLKTEHSLPREGRRRGRRTLLGVTGGVSVDLCTCASATHGKSGWLKAEFSYVSEASLPSGHMLPLPRFETE